MPLREAAEKLGVKPRMLIGAAGSVYGAIVVADVLRQSDIRRNSQTRRPSTSHSRRTNAPSKVKSGYPSEKHTNAKVADEDRCASSDTHTVGAPRRWL